MLEKFNDTGYYPCFGKIFNKLPCCDKCKKINKKMYNECGKVCK